VGYRATARHVANSLGVRGWVRNCPDGSVEAIIEGERAAVEALVDWCRRGPAYADVQDVELEWQQFTGEFDHFGIG
jgi:acylphosphatase